MTGGAAVSVAAIVIVLILVPFVRRWASREATIAASAEQWLRLQSLAANQSQLQRALDTLRLAQQSSTGRGRLVAGSTPAIAASNIQVVLQRYADESAVQLDRVDAVTESVPAAAQSGLLAIPMRLQGHGDIYGLVDFLYRLSRGEKLLIVDEFAANAGLESSAGTQSLTWSIRLHALYPSGS